MCMVVRRAVAPAALPPFTASISSAAGQCRCQHAAPWKWSRCGSLPLATRSSLWTSTDHHRRLIDRHRSSSTNWQRCLKCSSSTRARLSLAAISTYRCRTTTVDVSAAYWRHSTWCSMSTVRLTGVATRSIDLVVTPAVQTVHLQSLPSSHLASSLTTHWSCHSCRWRPTRRLNDSCAGGGVLTETTYDERCKSARCVPQFMPMLM